MSWLELLATAVPVVIVLARKWRRRSQKQTKEMKVLLYCCQNLIQKYAVRCNEVFLLIYCLRCPIFVVYNEQSISIAAGKLRAKILNFGAIVAELYVPDRHGIVADVLLGFSTHDGWKSSENPCMNTIIGRTAGRLYSDFDSVYCRYF